MIKYNGNNAINDWNLGDINITKAYYNGSVCYEKMESGSTPPTPPTPTPSYSGQYLTFVATESGTFKFSGNSIDYSLDSGNTWTTLESDTDSPTVTSGSKIMWKAELTPISGGIGRFSTIANFTVEGNAMSLLYGDNFSGETDLTGYDYAFYGLFRDCTTLTSAENLSLPATTLADSCYRNMFTECTSLTTAPELSATTLADYCYYSMFSGCTSLTTAPSLPATTLTNYCYERMFVGCTSLETALVINATTIPTETSGSCRNMFSGCTSLTTSPVLSAATLANFSYRYMFKGCTSLSAITCLATDISGKNCTGDWVNGVAANGTFTKAASMTSWTSGKNGIPNGWTVQDATD